MARKTVRIDIPKNRPGEYSKLLNKIKKQHESLGNDSPLKNNPSLNMENFVAWLAEADAARSESEHLYELSQAKMQYAKNIYGISVGQGMQTPGTLLYMLDLVKKSLLLKHKGNEEALSNYGFNVVVGRAKSRRTKIKES